MKSIARIAALFLPALCLWPPADAAEPLTGIVYVAAREFVVTVSPVDEESKNAENSDLYQRTSQTGEWTNLGRCKKVVLPSGEVQFLKTVTVTADGLYHYTSRPVVGGTVSSPPNPTSPPQAKVVVDTLAPIVEITSPVDRAEPTAGDAIDLAWRARDENLADNPVDLSWSADGGTSWIAIAEGASAKGDMAWTIPDDVSGPTAIRATAKDKAGNIGAALRQIEVLKLEVKTPAPAEPAAEIPERPATPPTPVAAPPEKSPVAEAPAAPEKKIKDSRNRAWLYYLMAVNLMRQNKPKDALQYYWLAVKADPEFIDAWADISLAYIDVGAYRTAREIAEQTRDRAPDRIDLMHLMGETYHAEAMSLLGRAKSSEDRVAAKELIDKAVEWYGKALETAADEWRLAEQAASYYRLGEICYYVNMDREGARAYWMKILDLHSPTPNPDLVLWTDPADRDQARRLYQRDIYMRVSLEAWQKWARGYVEQLDERERRGITDLMPANRVNRYAQAERLASECGGEYAPGRPDGRSLFSLPGQMGSPDPVPASVGAAPNAMSYKSRPAGDYSFYAPKGGKDAGNRPPATPPGGRGGRSEFSGGPDIPVPEPSDPYDFPKGKRSPPEWYNAGPYGNKPVENW